MITAIVQIKLPKRLSMKKVKEILLKSANMYRDVFGLNRKYYIISEEDSMIAEIYLWNSMSHADRFYTEDWKKTISKSFGENPKISFFENIMTIDNNALFNIV